VQRGRDMRALHNSAHQNPTTPQSIKALRHRYRALAVVVLLLATTLTARIGWTVPLEVYGRLPSIEDVALSPDGSRLAFVRTTADRRIITIYGFKDHKSLGGLNAGSVKLRGIQWADNDHLLIVTSVTTTPIGLIGSEREWSQLQVYDVATRRFAPIPGHSGLDHGTRVLSAIWGSIMVRHLNDHTVLFVPGYYIAERTLPALFRVDLQNGAERIVRQGTSSTVSWLVNADGEIETEENYDDNSQRWWLKQRREGHMQEIASGHEPIDFPRVLGFGPKPGTLLMETIEGGDPVWRLLSLQDGSFGPPLEQRRTLDWPIEDSATYRMIGGVYVDDSARYVFFDPRMQSDWNTIVSALHTDRVHFVSHSADFRRIVVRVDGPVFGYLYDLFDMDTLQVVRVGDVYDGVTDPLEVRRVTYEARDGLQIPAYLTLPRNRQPKNLPLIVLAHGGPAARDTADFDWWAQALADQGYAVLKPNYRGSDLNQQFLSAGFGEWGRKMQTDLSDGVRYLVKEGIADASRVCIVGGSYGGYAALAGVTLDPGVYRCAVSVAGLSDLKRMLQWESTTYRERTQRYWDRFMGVTGPSDPVLDQISPIKHLDALNVPVLLIHGRDDTVVPFEQSTEIFDALKHARKDVEMVSLKHEDHWLSRSETRLQMLQSSVAFLRARNPPD
jgi:dipeptidyl aminopeptidase/acylaminoacyl peptidase